MSNPFAFLTSMMCDRVKLVDTVERTAKDWLLSTRDAWQYIRDHANTPEWMQIIAREEIQKTKDNVAAFMRTLEDKGIVDPTDCRVCGLTAGEHDEYVAHRYQGE